MSRLDGFVAAVHEHGVRPLAFLAVVLLTGCGDIPSDPAGTLDRVRREHRFEVGAVIGSTARDRAVSAKVLARISDATGATPHVSSGALEPLLLELEAGRLDLVVGGRFDAKTPWKTRVALGPSLAASKTPAGETAVQLAARNGENAWITLVERQARAESGQP